MPGNFVLLTLRCGMSAFVKAHNQLFPPVYAKLVASSLSLTVALLLCKQFQLKLKQSEVLSPSRESTVNYMSVLLL